MTSVQAGRRTVLVTHGIQHNEQQKKDYVLRWYNWLAPVLPRDMGFIAAPWDSSGSGLRDIFQILRDRTFRRAQAEAVGTLILEEVKARRLAGVIGHSMGAAVVVEGMKYAIVRANYLQREKLLKIPVVALGGPNGHPVFRSFLRQADFGTLTVEQVVRGQYVHYYNMDDGICALANNFYTKDEGWEHVQIAVAGDGYFDKEHADKFYFNHPVIQDNLIKRLEQ